MPSTAFRNPTATPVNSGVTTPDNGWVADDVYAVFDNVNDNVRYGTFGDFSIPAGMRIVGIEAVVEGKVTGAGINKTLAIRYTRNGGSNWSNTKTSSALLDGTDSEITFGGASDTWGLTNIDESEVDNNTNFQFELSLQDLSVTSVDIDGLKVKLYYVPVVSVDGDPTTQDPFYETQIAAGGRIILLTLSGDTWVTAGATFDAQRQNIIDGLDAASSPSNGWNSLVQPAIPVGNVVRTSGTVVTITLPAVATYAIAADETITPAIPATAVTGAEAPTATNNFQVLHQKRNILKPNTLRPGMFSPGIAR